jgi:hypothetical protein
MSKNKPIINCGDCVNYECKWIGSYIDLYGCKKFKKQEDRKDG